MMDRRVGLTLQLKLRYELAKVLALDHLHLHFLLEFCAK